MLLAAALRDLAAHRQPARLNGLQRLDLLALRGPWAPAGLLIEAAHPTRQRAAIHRRAAELFGDVVSLKRYEAIAVIAAEGSA